MMGWKRTLARLGPDTRGAALIETAIVLPVLLLMCLGAFEVSLIVARQSELQGAAAEAAAIALAAKPDTTAEVDTVKQVIEASTGLAPGSVALETVYRCQGLEGFYPSPASCVAGTYAWRYLQIDMHDSYAPLWTRFGVAQPVDYNVRRFVMVAG